MKRVLMALIAGVVVLSASSALADWGYVGPTEVYAYYPYFAPAPVYAYPVPVVVARPVVPVFAPVWVGPAAPVYYGPVWGRPRVFVPGQPLRNAIRATWW